MGVSKFLLENGGGQREEFINSIFIFWLCFGSWLCSMVIGGKAGHVWGGANAVP